MLCSPLPGEMLQFKKSYFSGWNHQQISTLFWGFSSRNTMKSPAEDLRLCRSDHQLESYKSQKILVAKSLGPDLAQAQMRVWVEKYDTSLEPLKCVFLATILIIWTSWLMIFVQTVLGIQCPMISNLQLGPFDTRNPTQFWGTDMAAMAFLTSHGSTWKNRRRESSNKQHQAVANR